MTTYCAPCIADLALVREAVTSVIGTASCMAHAVLLTHATDDPGRRRQRLDALRELANGKAEHADAAEQAALGLLVQEYGLAGAMDMGGPSRRQQQPRPARQGGPGGYAGQAPGQGQGGPADEARRPKSRRGRGRGEGGADAGRGGRPGAETAPVTAAPGEDAAVAATPSAPAPSAAAPDAPGAPAPTPSAPAPSAAAPDAPGAPAPTPSAPAPSTPAPSTPAPSTPAPSTPAAVTSAVDAPVAAPSSAPDA